MMGRRRLSLLAFVLLGALLLGLAVYLLGNTRLDITGSSPQEGELKVETNFPNATCQKTLSARFPFVNLSCEEPEALPQTEDLGSPAQ